MKITDVKVKKFNNADNKMRGVASVIVDNAIAIHDIRIIEGDKGLFIAMPSRKNATGEYKDVTHPINTETRATFEKAILDEYNKAE